MRAKGYLHLFSIHNVPGQTQRRSSRRMSRRRAGGCLRIKPGPDISSLVAAVVSPSRGLRSRPKERSKLGEAGDDQVARRIWHWVGRTARSPFIVAPDEGSAVSFASGRIEIEIVASHHQDVARRYGEVSRGKPI